MSYIKIRYEVDVGSGCGDGIVFVNNDATENDIWLAIMDDLYNVTYEVIEEG